MKRFIITLVILLAVSVAYFYFLSMPRNIIMEEAESGVLDLRGADFSRMRYGLGGEWEFYFGELFTPQDFAAAPERERSFIHVPASWGDFGYPLDGVATYRLVLKTDETSFLMAVPIIPYASAVWVNGELVLEAGPVGAMGDDFVAKLLYSFVPVHPVDGLVEIVVQASNYGWFISGMHYALEIGDANILLHDWALRRLLIGVFIGLLVAMSGYHLILFLHRRKEWTYLAFSIFCFATAGRFSFATNGLAVFFWRNRPDTFAMLTSDISYAFTATSIIALIVFTHLVYRMPVGKLHIAIYTITMGINIIFAVLAPPGIVDMRIPILLPVLAILTLVITVIRSKRLKENHYNYLYLIALITFMIWPFIRLTLGDHLFTPALSSNLFLVLSQFFMMSISYAEAKNSEQRFALENAALESLSRMKSDYMANMSHETKTPLTVISVYVQLAAKLYEESGLADAEMSESLNRAQEEIMRVSRMNDNTLRLASMQTGHEEMSEINTSELLKNSTEAYRSIIEKQENEFIVNIPDALPVISGNADRLIQVMANLLTNANTHTKQGRITVDALPEDDGIKVTVADSGAGIAPDILPKVFERGVSGSGSTGFGLDICKDTVEAHGGKIWLDSKHGAGTTAIFTLPRHGDKVAEEK